VHPFNSVGRLTLLGNAAVELDGMDRGHHQ
jgi:hypothetical protein